MVAALSLEHLAGKALGRQTFLKLTYWVCGTALSTLEREWPGLAKLVCPNKLQKHEMAPAPRQIVRHNQWETRLGRDGPFPAERFAGNPCHQPSEGERIVFFSCLNSHHTSPDSGERQHKSKTFKNGFDSALRTGGSSVLVYLETPIW